MNLKKAVDSCLVKMESAKGVGKGTPGELAAFKLCEDIYQEHGGILYHSYKYKTDPDQRGNIKRGPRGDLYVEDLSDTTEIDILLVTPNRIFPIEVKAYKSNLITLTDDGIEGCFKTDKSPVHQNEMHCRHLYPAILAAVPEGKTEYIVPIVVFVDKCNVKDARSAWQKEYIKVTVLDCLHELILKYHNEELTYRIDLNLMSQVLNQACSSYEKLLPVREV